MIPYADFLYFAVLLYPLVPAVLLGLAGWRVRWWILVATVIMLAVQYPGMIEILPAAGGAATRTAHAVRPAVTVPLLGIVLGFALYQFAVARAFLWLRRRGRVGWIFHGAILLALAPLLAAKLLPLAVPLSAFGFIGISYVTFRCLDAVFGVQDGLITSLPPGQYLAFILFFPAISSGPVDRYRRFATDWTRDRTRDDFLNDLDAGLHRIFTGFLYKFVLALLIKRYWMDPAASGTDFLAMGSYMYAYSLYLFFDFAGYSAFAIGVGHFLGIHSPENFNRPFLATDIKDFWNRWHISLSTWFRDHVYMRFLLAARQGGWFRNKHAASYVGYYLLFGLMALWHGLAPHYLVYGFYHGSLFVAHDLVSRWTKPRGWQDRLPWRIAGAFTTLNLVCFGLLLFSGHLFQ